MSTLPTPRECVAALTPYASARRTGPAAADVWLNANEGESELPEFRRYPEFQPERVVAAYAAYANVDAEQLLVTRGADEGIDLVIRAYCEQGEDRVLIMPPTYGMYEIATKTLGVECASMPRRVGEAFNADTIAARAKEEKAKVVFLCTPNNPTGEVIELATIQRLAAQLPKALIVVDEAYIEFSECLSATTLIKEAPNVVVLRTLSKAFGLAGIRCGFLIAARNIRDMLAKVLAPYPIPTPVSDIAEAALTRDAIAAMRARLVAAKERRNVISQALRESTLIGQVFASEANFITFEPRAPKAILAAMRADGIAIRDFSASTLLPNTLRVSIGDAEECAAFLNTLTKLGASA